MKKLCRFIAIACAILGIVVYGKHCNWLGVSANVITLFALI